MADVKKGGAGAYISGNKIGFVVLGAVALLVAGLYWIASVRERAAASSLSRPPAVSSIAGQKATPRYNQEIAAMNAQTAKAAMASGASSFPVPIGDTVDSPIGSGMPQVSSGIGFGAAPPQRVAPPVSMPVSAPVRPGPGMPMDMPRGPQPYEREVASVLGAVTPQPQGMVAIAQEKAISSGGAAAGVGGSVPGGAAPDASAPETGAHVGTVVFGLFATAANSDMPGPVLVRIPEGRLKGAQIVGSFTREHQNLVVHFSRMRWDGMDWQIDAVAVDPNTSLPATRTDVDTHVISRYASLAGGAFLTALEGYGQAVAQSGQTQVTGIGNTSSVMVNPNLTTHQELVIAGATAAGNVAQIVGQSVQNGWNQPPTVTIAAGQGVGLLFLDSPHPAQGGSSKAKDQKQAQSPTTVASASKPASSSTQQQSQFGNMPPIRVGVPLQMMGGMGGYPMAGYGGYGGYGYPQGQVGVP